MYPSEEQFAEYLDKQGKAWAYEPIRFDLGDTTYTPDFYCPDDNTFYEVIGTPCAFYLNRNKYKRLQDEYSDIKFKIVKPNGTDFISMKKFKKNKKLKSILRQVRVPYKYDKELIRIAERECRTISSLIKYAIKQFLERQKN